MDERLKQQLDFVLEIDKEKRENTACRQSRSMAGSKRPDRARRSSTR